MIKTKVKYDSIIIGLGKTGISCVRYLSSKGLKLAVADNRTFPPELDILKSTYSDIPVYLEKFDQSLFISAKSLVISPGVSLSEPAIEYAMNNGVEIIGDIELFVNEVSVPIIAITGSNGKSTVATLVTEMIREAGISVELGGNIGTPAVSLLDKQQPEFYVLEISSFQLETIHSLNAAVSTVLNISIDHMDRYKSLNEYILTKKKVYMGDGCMVINNDDKCVSKMFSDGRSTIGYLKGVPKKNEFGVRLINGVMWVCYGTKKILPVEDISIKGNHNISNALAALAIGKAIGLDNKPMVKVLERFKGLPHRCELVTTINHVDWINDSKGTNPGATCAAIEGFGKKNNIILIAGGDGKGADFTDLAKLAYGRVRVAILIGRDAKEIALLLDQSIGIYYAANMDGAVSLANRFAKTGDLVLLSPACASLDMFGSYQERGTVFRQAVNRLGNKDKFYA